VLALVLEVFGFGSWVGFRSRGLSSLSRLSFFVSAVLGRRAERLTF
jgi:hypothetical protein